MKYINESITPYKGLETFVLGENLSTVREELKSHKLQFNQWVDPQKGCTVQIPWTNIKIDDCILLTFAEDILFSICLTEGFVGKLPNGAYVGMDFKELKNADKSIVFNEDFDDYCSELGYWVEKNVDSGTIHSIKVFIPELEDDDAFFNYDWVEKYK